MFDYKNVIDNIDDYARSINLRNLNIDLFKFKEKYEKYKVLQKQIEELLFKKNQINKEVIKSKSLIGNSTIIQESLQLKEEINNLKIKIKSIEDYLISIYNSLPNIIDNTILQNELLLNNYVFNDNRINYDEIIITRKFVKENILMDSPFVILSLLKFYISKKFYSKGFIQVGSQIVSQNIDFNSLYKNKLIELEELPLRYFEENNNMICVWGAIKEKFDGDEFDYYVDIIKEIIVDLEVNVEQKLESAEKMGLASFIENKFESDNIVFCKIINNKNYYSKKNKFRYKIGINKGFLNNIEIKIDLMNLVKLSIQSWLTKSYRIKLPSKLLEISSTDLL